MNNTSSPAPLLPSQAAARLFGGDLALLEEGLKRGLRVDAVWPLWETPLLHGVCLFAPPRAPDMVKAIIAAGGSLDELHRGLTPMMFALGGYNREDGDALGIRIEMIKNLNKEDAKPDLDLWAMSAVRLGFNAALEYFLDAGCDPNSSLEGGHTLLHEAYKQKNAIAGNMLVNRGADPHALNAEGKDPAGANLSTSQLDADQRENSVINADLEALDLAIRVLRDPQDMPEGRPFRL